MWFRKFLQGILPRSYCSNDAMAEQCEPYRGKANVVIWVSDNPNEAYISSSGLLLFSKFS